MHFPHSAYTAFDVLEPNGVPFPAGPPRAVRVRLDAQALAVQHAEQAVRRAVLRLDAQDLRRELQGREPDSAARRVCTGRNKISTDNRSGVAESD